MVNYKKASVKKVEVASDLYPLVHSFLVSSGMKKAAKVLEKEAKLVRIGTVNNRAPTCIYDFCFYLSM